MAGQVEMAFSEGTKHLETLSRTPPTSPTIFSLKLALPTSQTHFFVPVLVIYKFWRPRYHHICDPDDQRTLASEYG